MTDTLVAAAAAAVAGVAALVEPAQETAEAATEERGRGAASIAGIAGIAGRSAGNLLLDDHRDALRHGELFFNRHALRHAAGSLVGNLLRNQNLDDLGLAFRNALVGRHRADNGLADVLVNANLDGRGDRLMGADRLRDRAALGRGARNPHLLRPDGRAGLAAFAAIVVVEQLVLGLSEEARSAGLLTALPVALVHRLGAHFGHGLADRDALRHAARFHRRNALRDRLGDVAGHRDHLVDGDGAGLSFLDALRFVSGVGLVDRRRLHDDPLLFDGRRLVLSHLDGGPGGFATATRGDRARYSGGGSRNGFLLLFFLFGWLVFGANSRGSDNRGQSQDRTRQQSDGHTLPDHTYLSLVRKRFRSADVWHTQASGSSAVR